MIDHFDTLQIHMSILEVLKKVTHIEDKVLKVEAHFNNTVAEIIRLIAAAKGGAIGDDEKAALQELETIAGKLQDITGKE